MGDQLRIHRELGASLLANMFLCSFHEVLPDHQAMPDSSFRQLLSGRSPPEVAKLQMFLHFFDRIGATPLYGSIQIDRVVGVELPEAHWLASKQPLLPLGVEEPKVGLETRPDLAQVGFANMFIGGGVLSGGCVQEEIRFSICPELCLAMLVCPCMLENEAIQISGAEQFSTYTGYAHSLKYGGDIVDTARKGPDGSLLTAVLSMDALDLRSEDASLAAQLGSKNMTRELNKSLAAFTPVNSDSLSTFEVVATGNWGCGAFGGCAPLKALIQWASASQCNRRLQYFPFTEDFGPELKVLSAKCIDASISVGELLRALWDLQPVEAEEDKVNGNEDQMTRGKPLPPNAPLPLLSPPEDLDAAMLLTQVSQRLLPSKASI